MKNNRIPPDVPGYYQQYFMGSPWYDHGVVPAEHWTSSYASTNTPGFHRLSKAQRRGLNKPYLNRTERNTYGDSRFVRQVYYQGNWENEEYRGHMYNLLTFSNYRGDLSEADLYAEAEAKVTSKILAQLKSQSVNLAQAFAERKQTVNLLTTNINRIASAALAIRRGNLNHAVSLFGRRVPTGKQLRKELKPSPNNLANHWLEFSYGWRPLVSDIYGSAELLAKTYADNKPSIVTANSSASKTRRGFHVADVANVAGNPQVIVDDVISVTSRCRLAFAEDSALAHRLSSTGISNPALLAWELLPYSFVVDWFLPVGRYLGELDATNGLTFQSGSLSHSLKRSYLLRLKSVSSSRTDWKVDGGLSRNVIIDEKRRSPMTSFPRPNPPALNPNPLGVERALSGISLLTQLFRK